MPDHSRSHARTSIRGPTRATASVSRSKPKILIFTGPHLKSLVPFHKCPIEHGHDFITVPVSSRDQFELSPEFIRGKSAYSLFAEHASAARSESGRRLCFRSRRRLHPMAKERIEIHAQSVIADNNLTRIR